MHFTFKTMDAIAGHAIAEWHYEGAYSFYDMDSDPEDLKELLDPRNWEDSIYAVFDEHDELVGFFTFEQKGESVEIGLGLKPELTGRGFGFEFVQAGLAFAKEKFSPAFFRLFVATFNKRAIRLYEKVGFQAGEMHMRNLYGTEYEFLEMRKEG